MADVIKKYLDLSGVETLKGKLEGVMDAKDEAVLSGAKGYADGLAANYDAAGTAATKVGELDAALKAVAKSGKASDVVVEDSGAKIEASDVEGALAELADAIGAASSAGVISIEKSSDVAGIAARYTFKQGGSALPTVIDIPKDMVVESGAVVSDPEGKDAGTYLKLVLANAAEDEIFIPVDSLIEYVTSGSAASDMVVITVSDDHKVSASISDGSVSKAKLDAGVRASLEKADGSVQSVAAAAAEGNDGTILVDGAEVAVKGFAALASAVGGNSSAIGTLEGKVAALEGVTFTAITEGEINALFGAV